MRLRVRYDVRWHEKLGTKMREGKKRCNTYRLGKFLPDFILDVLHLLFHRPHHVFRIPGQQKFDILRAGTLGLEE